MIRWNNVIGIVLFFVGLLIVQELIVTWAIYGSKLTDFYYRTFQPWQRPILKLEILVFIAVVIRAISKSRNRP